MILGLNELAVDGSGAEGFDRDLVEADHRAERAGDQVKLVLHDELGRQQAVGKLRCASWLFVEWAEEAAFVLVP